jgi:hypothetical protein
MGLRGFKFQEKKNKENNQKNSKDNEKLKK